MKKKYGNGEKISLSVPTNGINEGLKKETGKLKRFWSWITSNSEHLRERLREKTKKIWESIKPYFRNSLIAIVTFSSLTFFFWWLYGFISKQEGVVNTILVIVVGLLVTGILAYLVFKKFQEAGIYDKRIETKPPPKEDKPPDSKEKKPEVPEKKKKKFKSKWILWPVGVVGSVVLLAIIWKSTGTWWDEYSSRSSYRAGSARSDQYLPTKDVLQIIAECESRGRQFNADGSLVRNPDPKSTAIGKYQIVASLHEESAKRMGYDIRTEAGNEAYATYLYERDGLRHWEATRYCWGPKLPAGLYNTTFSGVTISTRVVRVDKDWSEWVKIPTGQDLYYERMESVAFEIETMGGKSFQFPRDFRGHHRIPRDTAIRFRVTDASVETMPMWLRFSAL